MAFALASLQSDALLVPKLMCSMLYRLINLSDFNETIHLCKVRLGASLCKIWT